MAEETKGNQPETVQEHTTPGQRVDSPEVTTEGWRNSFDDQDRSFLEKVMTQGKLADPYDAIDITEVVLRVMRDLITKSTVKHVENERYRESVSTQDQAPQDLEKADYRKDANPIVGFFSKIPQSLQGAALLGMDSNFFISRVAREGDIPPTTDAETVIKAVFSATKDELSEERIQEIADCLPEGVKNLWEKS
ncbi:MAG: DUF2267 domain-containing protein [Kovacikia sp.]